MVRGSGGEGECVESEVRWVMEGVRGVFLSVFGRGRRGFLSVLGSTVLFALDSVLGGWFGGVVVDVNYFVMWYDTKG